MLMFTSTHLKEVKVIRELLDKYRGLAENRRKQIDLLEQQLEAHRNFTNYTHSSLKNAIDSNDKPKPSAPPKVPKATTKTRTHENFDSYTDIAAPLVVASSWDSSSSSYDYNSSSSCDSGSSSSSSSCD